VTSVGAIFLPSMPPERLRSMALAADESGLEQLWLWEDCFKESAVASMAAALAWTSSVRLGIGLMPVPMRNVATTAMEAATLDRLFPGRSIVGVGHGVLDWMGQIGARAASPLTLLGEYLDALRALLAGETVTTEGRYVRLDAVTLDHPPAAPLKVLAGAEGPKTLELAGAKADGTILPGGTTPERLRAARERIETGRERAGRTDPHEVVVFVMAATGAGAEQRLEAERGRWGFPEGDDVGVTGDAGAIAQGAQRWIDAGATSVVLQPTADEPDPEGFVRFIGEEVRPLIA
jgi:alkanesulfonate monooxygenase SsuD/methylene tetrahydromethanopterin reductase-like flavin-dependent oxidoreductase (luciferase family)